MSARFIFTVVLLLLVPARWLPAASGNPSAIVKSVLDADAWQTSCADEIDEPPKSYNVGLPAKHHRTVVRFAKHLALSELAAILLETDTRLVSISTELPDFAAEYVLHDDESVAEAVVAFSHDIETIRETLASQGLEGSAWSPSRDFSVDGVRVVAIVVEATRQIKALHSYDPSYETLEASNNSDRTTGAIESDTDVAASAEGIVPFTSAAFAPDVGWVSYDHTSKIVYSYFYWLSTEWATANGKVGYEHDLTIFGGRDDFIKPGAGTWASNMPSWYKDDFTLDPDTRLTILSYPATVQANVTYWVRIPVELVDASRGPRAMELTPQLGSWADNAFQILSCARGVGFYPPFCVFADYTVSDVRLYRDRKEATPLFAKVLFQADQSWTYNWSKVYDYTAKTCPANMYRGEYYNDITPSANGPDGVTEALYVRCDDVINGSWGAQSPGAGVRNDQFSIRWTRRSEFNAGTHNFFVRSDDGIRLWVDDVLTIDEWHESGTSGASASRTLSDGLHALKLEYYENGGDAKVLLQVQQAVPTQPGAVVASSPSSGEVLVRWTDASTDETYFVLELKPPNAAWDEVKTVSKNTTSTTITGLTPGALYGARLRACNTGGCSKYSNEASLTIVGVLPATCYTMNAFGSPTSGGYPAISSPFNCNNAGYVNGTQISITAVAHGGYQFATWTASRCAVANANASTTTCTVTGGGPITITANFVAVPIDSGTIMVRAMNNGVPWAGSLELNLTGPTSRTITSVPQTFTTLAGTYALTYSAGGPPGSMVSAITPSATQGFTPGGLAEFVISFVPRDPAVLVAALNRPTDIAVDATHVYWTEAWGDTGTVKRMPKGGGAVVTLVGGLYSPGGLALDSSYVYFVESPGVDAAYIARVPKGGGAVTTIASGQPSAWKLALDGSYVYWTDGYGGNVRKAPVSGGAVTTLANNLTTPSGIRVDSGIVYISEWDSPGRILSVPVGGGSITNIDSFNRSRELAYANGNLYWMESVFTNDAKIIRWPMAGGSKVRLATGLDSPRDLTTDGVNVYWIEDRSNGAVKQVPVGGGAVMMSSDTAIYPSAIATDGTFVYWVEYGEAISGTGKLKRTPVVVTPKPIVSMAATDPNAREASQDTSGFSVARTGSTAEPLTVTYEIGGAATNGTDYENLSGSVTIPAGQTAETIVVTPVDDATLEGSEGVVLSIASASTYEIGDSSGTATIVDNDATINVIVADAAASEVGADPGAFTITRNGSTAEGLNVAVSFSGTAVNGADYEELQTNVVIQAGSTTATVNVGPLSDSLPEGGEPVILTIVGNPNYRVGESSFGTIMISDLLSPPPSVVATAAGGAVDVSWVPVNGAVNYRIYRSSNALTYTLVGTSSGVAFHDSASAPNTAYLYKVRAFSSGESIDSPVDLATNASFAEQAITPGVTTVKSTHFIELMTAINAVRRLAGLPDVTFTAGTPTVGSLVLGQHLLDVRLGLDEARGVLGLGAVTHVDPNIVANITTVKAIHIHEIRDAVR